MNVRYVLSHPLEIGPRLLPSVRVGHSDRISVEAHEVEANGRIHFRFYVDTANAGRYESGDSGVTLMPNADQVGAWGVLAARAIEVITDSLGTEDANIEWFDNDVNLAAWRQRNSLDLMCIAEDLREQFGDA
jgi:hypothetical protein